MTKLPFAVLASLLAWATLAGAGELSPKAAAEAYLARNEAAVVAELRELVALPNVASNPGDIRANADLLVRMLEKRGVRAEILETPGAPVAVHGERRVPGAKRTLLFYAHFDGQPVGEESAWKSPPFEPALRLGRAEDGAPVVPWDEARYPLPDEARLYARSSSDDKGPIVALLAALDALDAAKIPLSANLKFFLEGEEEAGSPNLARTLELHREKLAADLWVFGDGPIDPRGLPRLALAKEAFDTPGMLAAAGIGAPESGLDYGASVLRPALNVTQLMYGGSGAQRNAIDAEATAGFDVRLVPGMTVAGVREAIEAHVRKQGYVLLDGPPSADARRQHARLVRFEWGDDGYPAAMSSPDEPEVARVISVMRKATDGEARIPPLMGGSLPIAPIGEILGVPFVIAPIVNADNNQHAPNENLRMRELRRGIAVYAALLAEYKE